MSHATPQRRRRDRGVDAEAHVSPIRNGKLAANGHDDEALEWGQRDFKVRQDPPVVWQVKWVLNKVRQDPLPRIPALREMGKFSIEAPERGQRVVTDSRW